MNCNWQKQLNHQKAIIVENIVIIDKSIWIPVINMVKIVQLKS